MDNTEIIKRIEQVSNSNCKREAISDVVSIMAAEGLSLDEMKATRGYYFDDADNQQTQQTQEPYESYESIMAEMDKASKAGDMALYRKLRKKLKNK